MINIRKTILFHTAKCSIENIEISQAAHNEICAIDALIERLIRLNPDAGEIGAGMLATIVAEARAIKGE